MPKAGCAVSQWSGLDSGHTSAFASEALYGYECNLRRALERVFVMQAAEDRLGTHTLLCR